MAKLRIFLLPFACLLAQPAHAYCMGWDIDGLRYYSVSKEFSRASYVAIVRVSGKSWVAEDGRHRPSEFNGNVGAFFAVSLIKSYKGRPPLHMRLFSENSTARFSLKAGREYIVFITKEAFDQPVGVALTDDTCGNSPVLKSRGSKLIAQLKRLGR